MFSDVRFRWIRRQDDLLDGNQIVVAVGIAELERVLPGNIELVARNETLPAAEDVAGVNARRKGEDNSGEPHGGRRSVICGETCPAVSLLQRSRSNYRLNLSEKKQTQLMNRI
jgi:hypothetical protein